MRPDVLYQILDLQRVVAALDAKEAGLLDGRVNLNEKKEEMASVIIFFARKSGRELTSGSILSFLTWGTLLLALIGGNAW